MKTLIAWRKTREEWRAALPDCLHCLKIGKEKPRKADSGRGLCVMHYKDLEIRELYPTRHKGRPRPSTGDGPPCRNCGQPTTTKFARRGLCRRCHADPSVRYRFKRQNARTPTTRTPCRHCQIRLGHKPRGLCSRCYYQPEIRKQYPSASKYSPTKYSSGEAQLDPPTVEQRLSIEDEIAQHRASLLPRKPGEGTSRCLHCGLWKCDRPLALCPECQAWMDNAREKMPADDDD